jgi:hypothetical protein
MTRVQHGATDRALAEHLGRPNIWEGRTSGKAEHLGRKEASRRPTGLGGGPEAGHRARRQCGKGQADRGDALPSDLALQSELALQSDLDRIDDLLRAPHHTEMCRVDFRWFRAPDSDPRPARWAIPRTRRCIPCFLTFFRVNRGLSGDFDREGFAQDGVLRQPPPPASRSR